jgi:hypothetical protein
MNSIKLSVLGIITAAGLAFAAAPAQAQTFASLTTASVSGERDCVSPNQAQCEKKALKQYNKALDEASDEFESSIDKANRKYRKALNQAETKKEEKQAKADYQDAKSKAKQSLKKDEQKAEKQYEKALK